MRLPGSGTIRVMRNLNSTEDIDALTDLFILRGVPGPAWDTVYCESFNGRMWPSHTCFACAAG